MKIQLKLVSYFAVMAITCGGLCVTALVRAQPVTFADAGATPSDPDANKKEAPANAPTSPTPTPAPSPKK